MKSEEFQKPKFISPAAVLDEIGLEAGDVVVDYGAGSGHWAIAAAKIVAPKGVVYALDNDIEILQLLQNLAAIRKLTNIEIANLNIEKDQPDIEKEADLVIVANILHSVKDKEMMIKNAGDMLKSGGVLLIVDWLDGETLFGPHKTYRLNQEEVLSMAEKQGFKFACTVDAGWHHFGMLFEKGGKANAQ